MSFIQRLQFLSKEIRQSIPKAHRYIDNHYVVESKKDHVIVFTRHPQEDSYVISNKTILGNGGPQYINKTLYKIDKSNTKLSSAPETQDFEKKNMSALIKAKEDSSGYKVVDITKSIINVADE